MYHLELRKFPHNTCAFNLTDQEIQAVVQPWAREKVVEFGEHKWIPQQAKITILEGPHLSVEQLALGKGWATALHESQDVTARMLAGARPADEAATAPAQAPVQRSPVAAGPADPLALSMQLASLLGHDPAGLLAAWREVAARAPGLSPSESLALAERQATPPGS